MKKSNNIVRNYIELAVRERIKKERPDYPDSWVEDIVNASMNDKVSRDVLYRAIELAHEGALNETLQD